MDLSIDIAVECDEWHALAAETGADDLDPLIRRAIAAALATSETSVVGRAELSVVLCDDAFIQTLNRTWRGKDKPTNVLSFPAARASVGDASPAVMLGDIVVAFETSAREAGARGVPLPDHLSHLIVHGFFHLLGFDHGEDADAETMESLESRVLATLGIASPYHDTENMAGPP